MWLRRNLLEFDYALFLCVVLIAVSGVVFIYSSTRAVEEGNEENFATNVYKEKLFLRQVLWLASGIVLLFLFATSNYRKILDFAYPLYIFAIFFLLLVLLIGKIKYGAQRWIDLGPFDFQPSEFSKIILVICLARYLGDRENLGPRAKLFDLFVPAGLVFLPFVLIMKEPDLGTALMLVPLFLLLLYVWGLRRRFFLLLVASGVIFVPIFFQFLRDYQKRRLLVFLNPNLDPLGAGYTIIQSKISIGSGRFFGKGWLGGTQNSLNFLPERHTDFIFSVVGEEWGFLGSIFLLLCFFFLIWRCLEIARQSKDFSAKLLVCGLGGQIAIQVLTNIAMTMGMLPVVGIPLPFVSYGGSSMLTNFIALGMILSVALRRGIF
jgi:rod shape determining protein RodA